MNDPDDTGETLRTVEYSDGFGRLVQTRTLAEDTIYGSSSSLDSFGDSGLDPDMTESIGDAVAITRGASDPDHVVVSGWSVFDNKGNVVEKYEPFFGTGWDFTDRDTQPADAKSVLMRYDARGRNVETEYPDGSKEKVVFGVPGTIATPDLESYDDFEATPWENYAYGRNDLGGLTHDTAESWSYADHYWTPSSRTMDALGRVVSSIARNHQQETVSTESMWYETKTSYDIRGNVLTVTDPLGRVAATQIYDLADRSLRTESIDAGDSRIVYDAASLPRETRDGKGSLILSVYDELNRQTHLWARDDDSLSMGLRVHTIYGDDSTNGPTNPEDTNHHGRVYKQYDEAGRVTFSEYDFKGNLADKTRTPIDPQLLIDAADSGTSGNGWTYTPHRTDWDAGQALAQRETALLDATDYETSTVYDALSRPKKVTYPQDADTERKELVPIYNRAGALESVELDSVTYIDTIAYNARGQKLLVALGNDVMTRYAYDHETFRMSRMRSREYTKTGTTFSETGTRYQDNGYSYDLVGNILAVLDRSDVGSELANTSGSTTIDGYAHGIPTTNTFLREYTYDPLSRLLTAVGACHDQRAVSDPWSDLNVMTQDLTAIREFTEEYTLDPNGNLTGLKHIWDSTTKYNRQYTIESGSNRLDEMDIGAATHTYAFDAVGNLVQENTSRHMTWDYADRMHTFRIQPTSSQASVYAHYLYDASGERVMKVVSKSGTDDTITIYVDGVFEHREHRTSGGTTSNDELHVMGGAGRAARLRVGTAFSSDNSPATIYLLDDHLGSVTFTLKTDATMYAREELTPYGESCYGSYTKKRYRFGGKEKDDGSGLNYHSARYYAPWMGRWTSADPAGMVDGPSLYAYARGNPIGGKDPTGTQTSSNNAPSTSEATGTTVGEPNQVNNAATNQASHSQVNSGSSRSARSREWREPEEVTETHALGNTAAWQESARDLERARELGRAEHVDDLKARLVPTKESLLASTAEMERWEPIESGFGELLIRATRDEETQKDLRRRGTATERERAASLVIKSIEHGIHDWVSEASDEDLARIGKDSTAVDTEILRRAVEQIAGVRQSAQVVDSPSAVAADHFLEGASRGHRLLGENTAGDLVSEIAIWGYDTMKSVPGAAAVLSRNGEPASPPWDWTRAWAKAGVKYSRTRRQGAK